MATTAQQNWWKGYYAAYYAQPGLNPNWGTQGAPWNTYNQGQQCLKAGGNWNGAQCVNQAGGSVYGAAPIAQGKVGYAKCVRAGNQVQIGTNPVSGKATRYCYPGVLKTGVISDQYYQQPGVQYYQPGYQYPTQQYYQQPGVQQQYTGQVPTVEALPDSGESAGGGFFDFLGLGGMGAEATGKNVALIIAVGAGAGYFVTKKASGAAIGAAVGALISGLVK